MFTNLKDYGGRFLEIIEKEIKRSTNVLIASGYISYDIIDKFQKDLIRIAESGGEAKLLLGMAFYEGLSSNNLDLLRNLSDKLEKTKSKSGVYVTFSQRYHGKVYLFEGADKTNLYVGSSNFSRSGLAGNIECTTLIKDEETKQDVSNFLIHLFSSENAVSIRKAEIVTLGTESYAKRISTNFFALRTYSAKDFSPTDLDRYPLLTLPLSEKANHEKSNLNIYFGKGRENTATGKIIPRPWYEVELIWSKEISTSPLYPKGDFLAYTDDGYIIPMKTSGDYYKNMRSKGNLQILGMWIKKKLQDKRALIPLTPFTRETLDIYGKDTIDFYKFDTDKYYMRF